MDDRVLAMLGDREAAERLTEAGVLIPCPGCGNEDQSKIECMAGSDMWMSCNICNWEGPFRETEEEARLAWNTRSPVLSPTQLALLRVAEEPRVFEEG